MLYIFILIVSYLLGSIPFGLILTRVFGHGDLRQVGSGNIGATNVMRVGGLRMAALVWLLDMAKAIVAVLIGSAFFGDAFGVWCGFAAVVGHCFPIWLRFHGGKGVSCLFGILLALNPWLFIICGIEWLIVALSTGYSSLGALTVFAVSSILAFVLGVNIGVPMLIIVLLEVWKHRENIGRLIGGTESKITWLWKK